jgi:hypothetical protein
MKGWAITKDKDQSKEYFYFTHHKSPNVLPQTPQTSLKIQSSSPKKFPTNPNPQCFAYPSFQT